MSSYDPFAEVLGTLKDSAGRIDRAVLAIQEAEAEHTVWRTRRNARMLTLLRAVEIFAGESACPVCGSPPKWKLETGKPPKDKQRQDLHDDKCELSIAIDHFEHCLRAPGIW